MYDLICCIISSIGQLLVFNAYLTRDVQATL